MARKREERAIRNAQRAAKKAAKGVQGAQDPTFLSLKHQLVAMGLTLREIPGDGNCLFRALGDQLDGTPNTHQKHRQDVVAYIRQHRNDFEPFVEDDVPFERHLSNLAELGTYGGNDCIVAFARLHQVIVIIHQLNAPLWQISGCETKKTGLPELHISYHNGDHYNSVRRIGDCTASPAAIKLTVQEGGGGGGEKKKGEKKSMVAGAEDASYGDVSYGDDDDDDGYGGWAADGVSTGHYWNDDPRPLGEEPVYEAPSKVEHIVMEETGCTDLHLIRKHLQANDYDVQQATDDILNFIILQHKGEYGGTVMGCSSSSSSSSNSGNGGIWGPNGTGTRLFGDHHTTTGTTNGGGTTTQPTIPPSYQKKTQHDKIQQRLRNQQHISNSKRKELKKQLRKQEAQERKRQQQQGGNGPNIDDHNGGSASDDNNEVIIVKDIGCLSI